MVIGWPESCSDLRQIRDLVKLCEVAAIMTSKSALVMSA
jgi:hypothetical protein